jgi:hypothetical protein
MPDPSKPKMAFDRTWFAIDGGESLDFSGQDAFQVPLELARLVVEAFSEPGDVVLDPFAGPGTGIAAAASLGRTAIGVERDPRRASAASRRVTSPSRVVHGDLSLRLLEELPQPDLVFTSPPHITFNEWDDEGVLAYWDDFDRHFSSLAQVMKPSSVLVVHLANLMGADGVIRPVAFEAAIRLAHFFSFVGEFVRGNTGPRPAAPGVDHSYLFVYRLARSATRRVEDVTPSGGVL